MVKYSTMQLDYLFEALSFHRRRSILGQLFRSKRPLTVSELAQKQEISLFSTYKHVKMLERGKLIKRKKIGRDSYVFPNPQAIAEAEKLIEQYRSRWNMRLDNLDKLLKEGAQNGGNQDVSN